MVKISVSAVRKVNVKKLNENLGTMEVSDVRTI